MSMWRRLTLAAFVGLSITPWRADAPCYPGQDGGIVWYVEGDWVADGRLVGVQQGVKEIVTLQPASKANTTRIMLLQNGGAFLTRVCPRGASCVDECHVARAGAVQMPIARFTGVRDESGSPRYRAAMSRASGWSDAVIAVNPDGSYDLADVFRGTQPRPIRYRLCPTDLSTACESPYDRVNWDGKSARVTSGVRQPGLLRIVEDDESSEAWIRLVSADRAPAVKAEYLEGVEAIKGWRLPESETPLPSLDRLWRVVLASAGTER